MRLWGEAFMAGLCGFLICFGLVLLIGDFQPTRFGPQSILVSPELQDAERVAATEDEE